MPPPAPGPEVHSVFSRIVLSLTPTRRIFITILSLAVSLIFVVVYTFAITFNLFFIGPENRAIVDLLLWPTVFPEKIHAALPAPVQIYTGWLATYSLLISVFVFAIPLYYLFDFAYRRAFRLGRDGTPLPVPPGAASLAAEDDRPTPSFINWIAVLAWVAAVIVYSFSLTGFYAFMSLPIFFALVGPPAALAGVCRLQDRTIKKSMGGRSYFGLDRVRLRRELTCVICFRRLLVSLRLDILERLMR